MQLLFGLVLLAAAVGCSIARSDPYPMPSEPPNVWQTGRAEIGDAVQAVVLWLTPRPGDQIELLAAEPIGVADGANVRFFLSRPVRKPDGTLVIGEQLEPLAGAIVANESGTSGPEDAVGIVAEIEAKEPGRFQMTAVRLRYRVNGGAEQIGEGIDVIFTLCAASSLPELCEE